MSSPTPWRIGDIIIDGGNALYTDTIRREAAMRERGRRPAVRAATYDVSAASCVTFCYGLLLRRRRRLV
jgi:hypothetical protein